MRNLILDYSSELAVVRTCLQQPMETNDLTAWCAYSVRLSGVDDIETTFVPFQYLRPGTLHLMRDAYSDCTHTLH